MLPKNLRETSWCFTCIDFRKFKYDYDTGFYYCPVCKSKRLDTKTEEDWKDAFKQKQIRYGGQNMNADDIYPTGNYLNVEICDKEDLFDKTYTIAKVGTKEVEEGKQRLQLSFKEMEYSLTLNVTNKDTLVEKFGVETDEWFGKKIKLVKTMTKFRGQKVPAIRIA